MCTSNHLNGFEQTLGDIALKIGKNKAYTNEFLGDYVENALNNETMALTAVVDEAISSTKLTKETVDRLCTEIEEFVDENKRIVTNFSENELMVDHPTGIQQDSFSSCFVSGN
jgi:hypothetical protein